MSEDKDAQAERARRIYDQIEALKRKPAGRPAKAPGPSDAPRTPRDFIADRMRDLDDEGGT